MHRPRKKQVIVLFFWSYDFFPLPAKLYFTSYHLSSLLVPFVALFEESFNDQNIGCFPTNIDTPMLGHENQSLYGNGETIKKLMDTVSQCMLIHGVKNGDIKYKNKKIDKTLGVSMRTITAHPGHPSKGSILKRNQEFISKFAGYLVLDLVTNSVGNNGTLDEKHFKFDWDQKVPSNTNSPGKVGVTNRNKISSNIGFVQQFVPAQGEQRVGEIPATKENCAKLHQLAIGREMSHTMYIVWRFVYYICYV